MSRTVEDLRRQIDTLDNKVHDLLMERADLVVQIGEAKRKDKVQVVQPDREALMVRRLLERHKGPLPREAIVRIWRELVGAVSLLQTGLKVVVTVPDDQRALTYWDMAKDYFSSVLPMQKANNALVALSMVREGDVTFAVLPWPEDGEQSPWWSFLINETGDTAMRIIARLPLGNRSRADANPEYQALVVARAKFETSGDDRSFVALVVEQHISRARIVDTARALGLEAISLHSSPARDKTLTLHFLEVKKYVGTDDPSLEAFLTQLDSKVGKAVSLGGYPTPPVYEDKVGKNAPDNKADIKKSA